jgi:hypothetical protein
LNRNGSKVEYERRLELLRRVERRQVRFPEESIREACRSVDPDYPEALRSMYRRRTETEEEMKVEETRLQLNVDMEAVVRRMPDEELARLAENVRRELEIRGIETVLDNIEDEGGTAILHHLRATGLID